MKQSAMDHQTANVISLFSQKCVYWMPETGVNIYLLLKKLSDWVVHLPLQYRIGGVMISVIALLLIHWSKSPRINMSHHADILYWFRAYQYLPVLLNAAVCLAKKQQTPISNFLAFGTQLYKVLLYICKNDSNAPILILNTLQNVDFIM
jgi:hypothetical protein